MSRTVKHLKRAAALGAAICCMILSVLPVSALRKYEDIKANCRLFDPDGLFSEEDQELITEEIRRTSEEIDMYLAVYVLNDPSNTLSDEETECFADDTYDSLFNVQYGEESDGLILVMNMPTHYNYVSTCGMAQLYYPCNPANNVAVRLTTEMIPSMQSGNYSEGISRFITMVKGCYSDGIAKHSYSYDPATDTYYYESGGQLVSAKKLPLFYTINLTFWVPCSILVGIIAAFIAMLIVDSKYKMKKSLNPSNYISQKDTHFYQKDDIFLRTNTTKVHIDSDRSGGGGGGGSISHMSSGGFSHGGGGSHW